MGAQLIYVPIAEIFGININSSISDEFHEENSHNDPLYVLYS